MKTTRIYYCTAYDTEKRICGYTLATDRGTHYTINRRQYDRCLRNRCIGGSAGVIFITNNKPIMIED